VSKQLSLARTEGPERNGINRTMRNNVASGMVSSSRSRKSRRAQPVAIYTTFSDDELPDLLETLGSLKAAEKNFGFWNNPADAASTL
jgi:hypothetical protein